MDRASRPPKGSQTSLPKTHGNNRRASSVESQVRRGSYLPPPHVTNRRGSSSERFKTPSSSNKVSRAVTPSLRFSLSNRESFFNSAKRAIGKKDAASSYKQNQEECISALVQFLEDTGFRAKVTPSSLKTPQMKNFMTIFEFMAHMIEPRWTTTTTKLYEDVSKLLALIGYPFPLIKSKFVSVNSTNWSTLLNILIWLMEFLKIVDNTNINHLVTEDDFEEAEEHHILNDYILQSYNVNVSDSSKDDDVFEQLILRKYDLPMDTEEVEIKINDLAVALEKKQEEEMEYNDLVRKNKGFENIIEDCQNYITKLNVHSEQRAEDIEVLKSQCRKKEEELNKLRMNVEAKQVLYNAQGFDGEEAKKYYAATKNLLMEKLTEKQRMVREVEQNNWQLQIQINDLKEKLQTQCQNFNLMWENLPGAYESAFAPLSSITNIPAAVKLYRNRRVAFPELRLTLNCVDEAKPLLEKVGKLVQDKAEGAKNVTEIQCQHMSEVETKLCDVQMKNQLNEVKLAKMEQELAANVEETEIEELKLRCDKFARQSQELKKTNESKKREIAELKKSTASLSATIDDNEVKHKQKEDAAVEQYEKVTKNLDKNLSEITAEYKILQAKMGRLAGAMRPRQ